MGIPRSAQPPVQLTHRRAPRQAKTPRGQKALDKVLTAARAELSAKPLRDVTVVSVAKAAKLPRASVLLQFPEGMPDIVDALLYQEEMSIVEIEVSRTRGRGSASGIEAVLPVIEMLFERADGAGRLYPNLLAEAMQFEGAPLADFRASMTFFGLGLLSWLAPTSQAMQMTPKNIALAETLGRTIYHLAATSPFVMGFQQQPSKLGTVKDLLVGIVAAIEVEAAPARDGKRRSRRST
jgi:hypothetical protein